ncbi:hypothetical protein L6164_037006 [Bauhinia variegata]|uniref:Uncharacterized protein n=1 Tax=Bauhinia variegata TaxID=167791 RepID=A0ACB9KIM5_BAUVA|nr:hypothetical protein L6164_037006 [Bauhinia variegata]
MTHSKVQVLVPILLVLIMAIAAAGDTPPGIAKNPGQATCRIKKYKHCYNLVHVCPKFCPDSCTVECASCKPICGGGAENPPPEENSPPSPYPPATPSPPSTSPSSPSTPTPSPPATTPSTPSTPTPSLPPTTPSSPSTPTPSPPSPPPSTPQSTPTPSPPATTPSTPTPSPPPTIPSSPSTPTPSPPPTTPSSPSTPTGSPSPSSSGAAGAGRARCRNRNYPQCYNMEYVCPKACRGGCEIDCITCKPVCKCDRPGAVCQDPRFIGGDGITFYFHGKKDSNFCLVSDSNLHINAHFIGRRNHNMSRDFTWVQSIAIFFGNHKVFVGALKASTWEDTIDHLTLAFDGVPVTLPESEGSTWQSRSAPSVFIVRDANINSAINEVEGMFRITAKVVPITEEDSRIHNYGITKEDCFAHLDLGFKFFSLSNEVSGVLGQTYRPDYASHVDIRAKMPVMGANKGFETSSLFAADCSVARFVGFNNEVAERIWGLLV